MVSSSIRPVMFVRLARAGSAAELLPGQPRSCGATYLVGVLVVAGSYEHARRGRSPAAPTASAPRSARRPPVPAPKSLAAAAATGLGVLGLLLWWHS